MSTMTEPSPIPSTIGRGHQDRRLAPGDLGGGDHHVRGRHLGGQQLLLSGQVLRRLLLGVPARAVLGLEVELDELGPEALHLLLGRGPHVVGPHHRPQPAGGGDGLQAGHPGPHHQHLGRRHGAGRRHEHREELGQVLGRRQAGPVAGHRGLGREGVHGLGPADAGQEVEAVDGGTPGGQGLHGVGGGHRLEEADQRHPLGQGRHLLGGRGLHPGHHGGAGQGGGGAVDDGGPGLPVGVVGEPGRRRRRRTPPPPRPRSWPVGTPPRGRSPPDPHRAATL